MPHDFFILQVLATVGTLVVGPCVGWALCKLLSKPRVVIEPQARDARGRFAKR